MTEQNEKSATSPVFATACFLGFLFFITLVATLPMPVEGFWGRVGIGFVTLCGGVTFYAFCGHFIALAMKAIVELSAAFLLFLNGAFFLWVWSGYSTLKMDLIERSLVGEERAALAIIVATVIVAAVANCLAFLVLYPLSRTVGTNIIDR